MKRSIPALAVFNTDRAVQFYPEKLEFISGYHDNGFAKLTRDEVELRLWAARDNYPEWCCAERKS